MTIHWKRAWVWLVVALVTVWVCPLASVAQDWRDAPRFDSFTLVANDDDDDDERPQRRPRREDPRVMTQAEWQAVARKVSTNLQWLGIQMGANPQELAVFVPVFTQEYLKAFQYSLMQGATKRQSDLLASQHTYVLIQRLAQQSGGSGGGGDGCVYSRGGSFCSGSDGFSSFSFK